MKPFMDKDFLLSTPTAQKLYHEYAADMPIIDYHCHVSPREIFEDRRFENITQVWLGGDHYKWRVMRSNGVEEKYITGDAPDREKFQKFAEALPRAIGNPMYHWCHLELKKYFGYEGALNGETAEEVWNLCNEKLKEAGMSVRGLIAQSNVAFVGTTDDPVDSLEWHQKIKEDPSITTVVAPSFRPDKALNIDKAGWKEYIAKLAEVCGCEIKDSAALECALASRIDHFDAAGCRASDHGLDYVIYRPADRAAVDMVFSKGMNGEALTVEEVEALSMLEPYGAGNPKPIFSLSGVTVTCMTDVGGGRHLKMRASRDGRTVDMIFFSVTRAKSGLAVGDKADVAFYPQINEYRGSRTVQLHLVDLRPAYTAKQQNEQALYRKYSRGEPITPCEARAMIPDREELAAVWRYLANREGEVIDHPIRLARKVAQEGDLWESTLRTMICLEVMESFELLHMEPEPGGMLRICLQKRRGQGKVSLLQSPIIKHLQDIAWGKERSS